ncbi:uncharacterized protein RHO25_003856 [Cercospora beticola]|uniref:Uncharacterized protein n=1 Tax=Cercospora beticola TaxID=122368 RepID=A0ABZ0NI97_CERBT|nr:hypothetical protein RHO25_003856 [Cercospora beticola]
MYLSRAEEIECIQCGDTIDETEFEERLSTKVCYEYTVARHVIALAKMREHKVAEKDVEDEYEEDINDFVMVEKDDVPMQKIQQTQSRQLGAKEQACSMM